jgi:hypothetical protein
MDKTIKCLLLKSNQVIVSEVIEVVADLGEPDCKLINPFLLDQESFELVKWLTFTDQNEILIRSEDILTFVDPTENILEKYLENS